MNANMFEEFMTKTLEIAQDFAKENETIITFGVANQDTSVYKIGESPLIEELLYYVNTPAKGIFYLRFRKIDDEEFRVFIDNGSISLTLNQNLERCTNYPSNDFNKCIDNIKGDYKERLMKKINLLH